MPNVPRDIDPRPAVVGDQVARIAVAPPIVLSLEPWNRHRSHRSPHPPDALPRAFVPVASVPMKSPSTRLSDEPSSSTPEAFHCPR